MRSIDLTAGVLVAAFAVALSPACNEGSGSSGHGHSHGGQEDHAHGDEGHTEEGGHAHGDEGHGDHGGHDDHAEGDIEFSTDQQTKVDFAVGTVRKRSLKPSVMAQGFVRSARGADVRIRAPFAGRVIEPSEGMPEVGQAVEAGDTVATIVPKVDANALPMLRSNLSQAEARLERQKREVDRLQGLVEDDAIPQKRLLDAKSELDVIRSEVQAARQRIGQYQSFDRGGGVSIRLTSPIAGTIAERPVASGEYVEAGEVVMRTFDERRLRLEARVAEANLPDVDRVEGAWFKRPEDGIVELGRDDVPYFGTVERIDPVTRTRSFWFGIPDDVEGLTAGQYHRVHLWAGESRETVAVPATALLEQKGVWTVYVAAGAESFARRNVETGIRDGGYVEITQGLQPGDKVVTRGAYYVKLAATASGVGGHHH
jgi:RND family efflux transporter MFP subunit